MRGGMLPAGRADSRHGGVDVIVIARICTPHGVRLDLVTGADDSRPIVSVLFVSTQRVLFVSSESSEPLAMSSFFFESLWPPFHPAQDMWCYPRGLTLGGLSREPAGDILAR